MLSGPSRSLCLTTLTSGLSAWIVSSAESTLETPTRCGVVDHLALQVGEVDDVIVDDAERADARSREVEGGGRAQAAGAEQQHLGVEQLLLALDPDLVQQQMARVAVALLGAHEARNVDVVAAVLPQREAAGHRGDVLVAEVLDQRARGPGRALTGGAVQDHGLRLVRCGALDAGLEVALGHVARAGDVAGGPLLVLTHVDHERSFLELLTHG